ncbi:RidA family protein [Cognatishimia sp. 1_MG-2023]|uniref:RidA family protein n=1 Tax=Cognatishimia sp. 1_MG-2023 TaxID=3062642 RepID=UPI0026E2B3A7|nr:RidA family protein [Cognatishimia sp. 1_MG-2023]MDO6728271.1 RidA family protein [Cognatishimia sp. 1_MG-2023]
MKPFKTYKPAGTKEPYGTYVHALEVPAGARTIYISGQIPVAPDGTVPKTMTEQARICWGNIESILQEAGLTTAHLVQVSMYLTDRSLYQEADSVSAEFLKNHRTAAACYEVSSLIEDDWLIEVDAIAAVVDE